MLEGIRAVEGLRLDNRRVFIRVDFDVPVDTAAGKVNDDEPIRRALPTIRYAAEQGARVILGTHLGEPQGQHRADRGLEPVGMRLAELTGYEVLLPDDCVGDAPKKVISGLRPGQLCLLENLRFHPGETRGDDAFARELAQFCDVYVNDAFSLANERAASTYALPRLLASRGMGLALQAELTGLLGVAKDPARPLVALLGGTCLADMLPLLDAILPHCDAVCVGGALSNTLLAASGVDLQGSKVEEHEFSRARTLMEQLEAQRVELLLPSDVVTAPRPSVGSGVVAPVASLPAGHMALDIGPETIARFRRRCLTARSILWSGPMGLVGREAFSKGTHSVAEIVAQCSAHRVALGSVTRKALASQGVEAQASLICSTSQAAWDVLLGRRLPAIEVLRGSSD